MAVLSVRSRSQQPNAERSHDFVITYENIHSCNIAIYSENIEKLPFLFHV